MKKFYAIISVITMFVSSAYACFDTYIFLQRGSMVYPNGLLAIEGFAEYTVDNIHGNEDMFLGSFNAMFGVHEKFSVQIGVLSDEKSRTSYKIDHWSVRGVYNMIDNYQDFYNLDIILEHHSPFDFEESAFEISAPSIFYLNNYSFVIHPVLGFGRNVSNSITGHGGVFYNFNNSAIIGLGAEFESSHNSNYGKRHVENEFAASLFFGANIGNNIYFQNELIKGLGSEAMDFGYAASMKLLFPNLLR